MFNDKEARAGLNAVQDELAELRRAVSLSNQTFDALSLQMASLTDTLAFLAERDGKKDAAIDRQQELLDTHRKRLDAVTSDIHAVRDLMNKLDVRMERIQRQAIIDNREMRDNYAALAASIRLLQGNGPKSAGTNGFESR